MTPAERKRFRDQIQWAEESLEYAYNQCDDASDLFDAISNAWLMFRQARKDMLKMLDEAEIERFLSQD